MSREYTDEEIRIIQDAFTVNEAVFLREVRSLSHIGYGRMMQIIEREWYRSAQERGDPVGGVLVTGGCLGFLSRKERREFDEGYRVDPLFME